MAIEINRQPYDTAILTQYCKMADAVDVCTVAVEVKHGSKTVINIIGTFKTSKSLAQVYAEVSEEKELVLNKHMCGQQKVGHGEMFSPVRN